MLNITLKSGDLQGPLDVYFLSSPQSQSSPEIRASTGRSAGPGGPFAALLHPGNSWYSPANSYRLTLQQSDGNLILEVVDDQSIGILPLIGGAGPALDPNAPNGAAWRAVWSAKTNGKGVDQVAFQIDGNLVAYAGAKAVFASGTSGHSGTDHPTLAVQDDGNLVIYTEGPRAIWATNTSSMESRGFNA